MSAASGTRMRRQGARWQGSLPWQSHAAVTAPAPTLPHLLLPLGHLLRDHADAAQLPRQRALRGVCQGTGWAGWGEVSAGGGRPAAWAFCAATGLPPAFPSSSSSSSP